MRYALTLTTAPTGYPVSLAEARQHLRVDGTDDDAMIDAQIIAATNLAENYCRRQFMRATYTLTLDSFPLQIKMPKPPLAGVTSIAYLDTQGVSQTLATTVYTADTLSEPGRIALKYGQVWPPTYDQINAITIVFTAGWADAGKVPEAIKSAIKLYIGDMYQNRESTADTPIEALPTVENLLRNYVVDWWDEANRYETVGTFWKSAWLA